MITRDEFITRFEAWFESQCWDDGTKIGGTIYDAIHDTIVNAGSVSTDTLMGCIMVEIEARSTWHQRAIDAQDALRRANAFFAAHTHPKPTNEV